MAGLRSVSAADRLRAGILPGAAAAGAATNQTKSAATARAQSSGRAAVGQGGQATGAAVGRGPAMVTSTFPVLTPQQRQIQKEATNRPDDLGPKRPQGAQAGPLVKPASPSSAALAGARPAAANSPLASTDFDYFRSQNTTPGNFQSGVDEPSTANDGNAVLYTGNWYGALSTDSGTPSVTSTLTPWDPPRDSRMAAFAVTRSRSTHRPTASPRGACSTAR